jgi:hypothetical protein
MSRSAVKKLISTVPWYKEIDATSFESVDSQCIGISNSLPPQEILRLATENNFTHICQRQGLEFKKEIITSENLIHAPESFFEFPVASVFSPNDLNRKSEMKFVSATANFNSSYKKREILDMFVKVMESKGVSQTISADVVSIADEMYTNAIFNAPFVDKKSVFNPGVDRSDTEIVLPRGRDGLLVLAHDKNRLMIACQDPFGALNIDGYLSKIKSTYERGAAASMNFGPGGAGIGSYIIFNTCVSFYVGVKSGRASIVACVLPLGMSNRKRTLMPKHIHWLHLEEE